MADDRVDLRHTGFLNPIKDQGIGSCCYAFTACDAVEYWFHKEHNGAKWVELSAQDLYDHLISDDVADEIGRNFFEVFTWIVLNGCVREASCLYRQFFGPPAQDREVVLRLQDYEFFRDIEQIKEELRINGPVCVVIPWIQEMADFVGEGVYRGPANDDAFVPSSTNFVGRHALLLVGYDSENVDGEEVEFWYVRNSHGPTWGSGGYGKFDQSIMYEGEPMINIGFAPREILYTDLNGNPYAEI